MAYTVGAVSLGCNKNRVDTETALGLLKEKGYRLTSRMEEADILLVNTCGFIDPAKEESIDTILEMARYKQTGRCRLLVVTGCLAQRYEKSLLEEMCGCIVSNKAQGLYDGAYKAVELAMALKNRSGSGSDTR